MRLSTTIGSHLIDGMTEAQKCKNLSSVTKLVREGCHVARYRTFCNQKKRHVHRHKDEKKWQMHGIKYLVRPNPEKNIIGHAKKLVLYSSIGMKFFSRAMTCL